MDARSHIKRGLFWLGSASLAAQLFDLFSTFAVLWFLTKTDMGVATLAWTIAVIVESFNGLGVGTAMLQAPSISRRQLDSIFWYTTGLAALLVALISATSPLLAAYYDAPDLRNMIVLSASKLLFVGAALVPLQMMNRKLRYREIGAVQTLATFLAAALKVALAATGWGAWALVIAFFAQGVFTFLGAVVAEPFAPKFYFNFREIRDLVVFGAKVATSGIIYHFYRNADYLAVGRLLGNEALGVYRVAFDIAMTPAMTLLNIVNRTAFPVFSRLTERRQELAETFLWIQKNLGLLSMPIAIFIAFGAEDLMFVIGKSQWIAAAPAIRVLAAAAWLRCLAQTFPQLFHACGRPSFAVYDSLASLIVLGASFMGWLVVLGERLGILAVCYAWLAAYPILLSFLSILARRLIPLEPRAFFSILSHPFVIALLLNLLLFPITYFSPRLPFEHIVRLLVIGAITIVAFSLYLKLVLGIKLRRAFRWDLPAASEDAS
jgi:O-antigen/teichoic acid export membrane protein